jgi:hypothetical protein
MNLLESTEEQLLAVDQFFESQWRTASGYNTASPKNCRLPERRERVLKKSHYQKGKRFQPQAGTICQRQQIT